MALSHSIVRRTIFGNRRVVYADTTFDSSYASGGEALVPTDLGLSKIEFLTGQVGVTGGTVSYDRANNKLLYFSSGSTEGTGDLSAIVVRIKAEGN